MDHNDFARQLGDHISEPFGLGMRETFRALHQAVFGSEIESTPSLSEDEPNNSDDAGRRRPIKGEQAHVR